MHMKKFLMLISFLLVITTIAPVLSSCGGNGVPGTSEPESNTTEPLPEVIELPEDHWYDGYTFNILVTGNFENDDFDEGGGLQGTQIEKARYDRDQYLANELGVIIDHTKSIAFNSSRGAGPGYQLFSQQYASSTYDFDAGMIAGYDVAVLASTGYLHDLKTVPYLDLTKSWWDQKANEQLEILGKMFFTTGDISTTDNLVTHAILFNKGLITTHNMTSPYDLVHDDNWTFDTFGDEVKKVSGQDLTGEGTMDEKDLYGLLLWNDPIIEAFSASGEYVAKVNDEGLLEMSLYNQRSSAVIAKYLDIIYDRQSAFNYQADGSGGSTPSSVWNTWRDAMFNENRAVYYLNTIQTTQRHRDKVEDFGIVPFPKYEAAQESYGHQVSAYHTQYFCIPFLVEDAERTGAISEALAWQGQELLTPAFYDLTLVGKTIRDDESEEMLDIIFSTHVFDLGVLYTVASVNTELARLAYSFDNTFASMWARIQTAAEERVSSINEQYRNFIQE
jgi:hypothetical protein